MEHLPIDRNSGRHDPTIRGLPTTDNIDGTAGMSFPPLRPFFSLQLLERSVGDGVLVACHNCFDLSQMREIFSLENTTAGLDKHREGFEVPCNRV